jgi:branched-chain amino acid aminotransferase
MLIPMDEHGFHRGDGVFEAVRVHERAYIDLTSHLKRLERSAQAIQLKLPQSLSEIERICIELARRCDSVSGILRLYVTRGPGSFSPSPAESAGGQIYAAMTAMKPADPARYANGVRAMVSTVPAKERRWSQIKSCNYLQNVLMKKECLDRGFDFALSVDEEGRVCEGATENLLIVTRELEVLVPRFDYTLRGTTVSYVMKIAEELKASGQIQSVGLADLRVQDVLAAKEAAFVGTTLGVLPVKSLDESKIGAGREICLELNRRLMSAMTQDAGLRTEF